MAASGHIAMPPAASAGSVVEQSINSQATATDDDDSVLSSAGTDIFDKSFAEPSSGRKWQLDINGVWQRYGSSDSAPSTTMSSLSSSIGMDEHLNEKREFFSPTKKRMSDGTFKHPLSNVDAVAQPTIGAAKLPLAAVSSHPTLSVEQQPKKKRGRPSNIELARRREDAGLPPLASPSDINLKSAVEKSASKVTTNVRRQSINPSTFGKAKQPINVRPRSSLPTRVPPAQFASQCIEAALSARLDPYSLHTGEHRLLGDLLMSKEITIYLNIRNAILRLWSQNPLCSVTFEEALGCAKDSRYFNLAQVAYKWLGRNGHINFGCTEVPRDPTMPKRVNKESKQRVVAVIGAGVSGLTAARQLENTFANEASKWINMGERPPRVVVFEARDRIGGRVYSKPLRSQVTNSLPDDMRNTAEMGAMIVTGFERGNPLDTIIRGQLGLHYHLMRDSLTIYDVDGKPVNEERDMRITELYSDISERAGHFRATSQREETLRGDEHLINRHSDPAPEGFSTFQLEPLPAAEIKGHEPTARRGRRRNAPAGAEKITGRSQVMEGGHASMTASRAARNMGWELKQGVAKNQNVSLDRAVHATAHPTLGATMDEAIRQYQDLVDLTPLDLRLLNWHHANLEYANAAPVSSLSLSGHDQDTGNEFEGYHAEVIGGYTQVPRGLYNLPTKLDVRFEHRVTQIARDGMFPERDVAPLKLHFDKREPMLVDEVVITAPLGVLKARALDFVPPLPDWKRGPIDRMGFGLLNKVVLLYEKPFWDEDRDMFGLLNESDVPLSLNPSEYERKRGRFYLIWNASKISGRPMLIALLAGKAAHDAETTDTNTIIHTVTSRLRGIFTRAQVPMPLEVIVTRWQKDPHARGTYSYVGPETRPEDYDLMAKPVGNMHFAGEATCGTHPATVHGAFISGLRVASEVLESMCGPIELPNPLVEAEITKRVPTVHHAISRSTSILPTVPLPAGTVQPQAQQHVLPELIPELPPQQATMIKQEAASPPPLAAVPTARKQTNWVVKPVGPPAKSVCATDSSFWVSASFDATDLNHEAGIVAIILTELGERPTKPTRPGVNPFLLYTKEKWEECRASCAAQGLLNGKDVIRQTLGKWWKAADEAFKEPYRVQSQAAQTAADTLRKEWETKVKQWDQEAARIRREYASKHANVHAELQDGAAFGAVVGVSKRKTNVSNCVVLDHA